MLRRFHTRIKTAGQAIVEFALAITLIGMLLSAAVDLGFIFFSLQSLNSAAQEGASYGARWLVTNGTTGERQLDTNEIRNRVRLESGASRGGVANLLDLDNDEVIDVTDGGSGFARLRGDNSGLNLDDSPIGGNVVDDYIRINLLQDDGFGNLTTNDTCIDQLGGEVAFACYVRVTVLYDYKLFFGLAPSFGDEVRLRQSHTVQVIDPFLQRGESAVGPVIEQATPTYTPTPIPTNTETNTPTSTPTLNAAEETATEGGATLTPSPTAEPTLAPSATPTLDPSITPSVTPTLDPSITVTATPTDTSTPTNTPTATPTSALYVAITVPATDGQQVNSLDDTRFRAIAYDRSDADFAGEGDQSDGVGVDRVEMEIRGPSSGGGQGTIFLSRSERSASYCFFSDDGDECYRLGNDTRVADVDDVLRDPGTYTLRARAFGDNGARTDWVERTFNVPAVEMELAFFDDEDDAALVDGFVVNARENTFWRVEAYDESVGTGSGDGVEEVQVQIISPNGFRFAGYTDDDDPYCVFGENRSDECIRMSDSDFARLGDGTYTMRARARNELFWSEWEEITFTVPPVDVVVEITNPISNSAVITDLNDTDFRVIAYDPLESTGDIEADDGKGIAQVQMEIIAPGGFPFLTTVSDRNTFYCPFGGSSSRCDAMDNSERSRFGTAPVGTFTLRARARLNGSNRWSNWVLRTFEKPPEATPTPTGTATPGASPTPTNTPTATPTPQPCEPPQTTLAGSWSATDVNGATEGTTIMNSPSAAFICGSGSNIWNRSDQFRFVHQEVSQGFVEFVARLNVWEPNPDSSNTRNFSRSGIMLRSSTNANASHYMVRVMDGRVSSQWRESNGGRASSTSGAGVAETPTWLRIQYDVVNARVTGSFSRDGNNWIIIDSRTIRGLGPTFQVGLATTGLSDGQYARARYDSLAIVEGTPPTPTNTPTPTATPLACAPEQNSLAGAWQSQNIGSAEDGTTIMADSSQVVVCAQGENIWEQSDNFRFVYQEVDTDSFQEIIARLVNWRPNPNNGWSRTGLMIRDSVAENAPHLMIRMRRDRQISAQRRTSSSENARGLGRFGSRNVPVWMRITNDGNDRYSVWYSSDGTDWRLGHGNQRVDMGDTILVGIATTGRDGNGFAEASYTDITIR